MGFRTGAYAKVWEVRQTQPWCVDLRLTVSRKDKKTDSYVTDFSGYVRAFGKDNVNEAAKLQAGDRIRLGDVDVTSKYDAEKKQVYINFALLSFEMADGQAAHSAAPKEQDNSPAPLQDGSGGSSDDGCPF